MKSKKQKTEKKHEDEEVTPEFIALVDTIIQENRESLEELAKH